MGTTRRLSRVIAAAVVVAAAGLSTAGAGAAPAVFADPGGDSAGAPDITNVSVSDGAGAVTVVLTATALTAGQSINLFLDTDKNAATGSPSGSEFGLEVWQEADDWGWDMSLWSGGDWKETPQNPAEHFSRSGNVFTWTFPTSDISGAAGFTLWALGTTLDVNGVPVAADTAPDGGSWVYDLSKPTAAVVPKLGKPFAVPAVPRAGTLLSLSIPVTRTDTGARLTGGTVTAAATIAGKAVPRTVALSNGTVQIAVAIPKNAKGKTLQVKVTVTLAGQTGTQTVSFRIR